MQSRVHQERDTIINWILYTFHFNKNELSYLMNENNDEFQTKLYFDKNRKIFICASFF